MRFVSLDLSTPWMRIAVLGMAPLLLLPWGGPGSSGAAAGGASTEPGAPGAPVDFVREIRPILSGHCFACHGPDAESRKAGLSLVTFEDATRKLRSGAIPIVPGKPEDSEVWRRINDQDDPMPPVDAHDALSPEQVEIIGRWIREGASYAPHWAYVAPVATRPPAVKTPDWARTAIDRYILARLEAEGLTPAPDADPVTLIRRVTFDLLGLPATPEEVDAFVGDRSEDALAHVVDRLLASPHFGERMAMLWLDLVRFADTCGYHGDQDHNVWPYRDYVINAFNDNKPFDQFTIEQLGGDLLEEPTQEQLVATAYNRLLQTSHEGGVQLKEYRAIYMADRVRNVSETWMGATIGCAQCHDHKYDPYTARDFYSMGAFFADVDDEEHLRNQYGGLNTLPTRRLPMMKVLTPSMEAALADLDAREKDLRAKLAVALAKLPSQRAAWERGLARAMRRNEVRESLWVDDAVLVGGKTSGRFEFVREEGVKPHRGQRYRVQASRGLVQHYVFETTSHAHQVAEGDVFFAWIHMPRRRAPKAVMLQFNVEGDWNHRAVWGGDQISYGRRKESWKGYFRKGKLPARGRWVRIEVPASEVGLEPGQMVSGMAFSQFGGKVLWDEAGVLTGQVAPPMVMEALALPPESRTARQKKAIEDHQERTTPEVVAARRAIEALAAEREKVEADAPVVMYTKALETPRVVRILPRGNWLDESGEIVEPAIPAFMGKIKRSGRATRLDLARWLVTPAAQGGAGELTARVFVNRVWAILFGEGLCPSTEDFGGQGVPPTHLGLLDRLALDFVASGWDVKTLVRSLVLTRTYGLSSVPSPAMVAKDPMNLLFARQMRRRLPAESVRDTLLAISGLLNRDVGGRSVKPPQPAGYYRHLNFPTRRYRADTGPAQWRRGVYVHWQRQYLHPMLRAFDAPTREECTARRPVSNTPLAALTLLNDPVFVEASRALARRLIALEGADAADRIRAGLKMATGRVASDAEVAVLRTLLDVSRDRYGSDAKVAAAFVGEPKPSPGSERELAERAAWTQVARAILNLHETITRE